jgi:hypothetical protein
MYYLKKIAMLKAIVIPVRTALVERERGRTIFM